MSTKFIKNEHLNFIKRQIAIIKDSSKKNVPATVLTAVIDLANANVLALFPSASEEQLELLDLSKLKTDDDYAHYIQNLLEFLQPFPQINEQQLKRMFPKKKKLKMPDLSALDYRQLTYLSWNDIGSNKKVIVYELEGEMVGIECEFTPITKKNHCSFCHSFSNVVYFSTVTKAKMAKNPDYYKAIGNLICADSSECNKNITDVAYLTQFFKDSLGK